MRCVAAAYLQVERVDAARPDAYQNLAGLRHRTIHRDRSKRGIFVFEEQSTHVYFPSSGFLSRKSACALLLEADLQRLSERGDRVVGGADLRDRDRQD